jgi:threonine dehydrogenase-like Zn-dependent dehydrogenase
MDSPCRQARRASRLAPRGPRCRRAGSASASKPLPDPVLLADDDIILRVTATAICGSDLHIYRGKIPMVKHGDILGHEFMGVVEDAGPGVTALKRGDRVVVPFVIACGECFYCNKTLFAACETTPTRGGRPRRHPEQEERDLGRRPVRLQPPLWRLPGRAGGIRARAQGQRGPDQDSGCAHDEQVLFLSDILPTGYQAAVNAELGPGSASRSSAPARWA